MALLFLFLVLLSYYYSNCKWAMKGRERKEEKKSAQHNTIITRAYPSKSLECSRFASASSTVVASIQSHFCPFQKERIKIFKTVQTVYVCADTVVGWMGGYWWSGSSASKAEMMRRISFHCSVVYLRWLTPLRHSMKRRRRRNHRYQLTSSSSFLLPREHPTHHCDVIKWTKKKKSLVSIWL